MKTILLTASVLVGAVFSLAQEPKPDFKIAELTNKEGGLNVTSLKLEPMLVEVPTSPDARVELTADFTHGIQNGKAFVLPVGLDFTFRAPKVSFPRPPDVTVVFDGVSLKLRGVTETPVEGNITVGLVGEGIATSYGERGVEVIGVMLPANTFTALAKARSVELQVGALNIPLRENHLKALREVLRRSGR